MINYPELLDQLNFKANLINSRNKSTFYLLTVNTKYNMSFNRAKMLKSEALGNTVKMLICFSQVKFSCCLNNTY